MPEQFEDHTTPAESVWRQEMLVRENVRKMWEAGMGTRPMAKKVGMSHTSLRRLAHSMGLSRPSPIVGHRVDKRQDTDGGEPQQRVARVVPTLDQLVPLASLGQR